jgi:hypothetical protein
MIFCKIHQVPCFEKADLPGLAFMLRGLWKAMSGICEFGYLDIWGPACRQAGATRISEEKNICENLRRRSANICGQRFSPLSIFKVQENFPAD